MTCGSRGKPASQPRQSIELLVPYNHMSVNRRHLAQARPRDSRPGACAGRMPGWLAGWLLASWLAGWLMSSVPPLPATFSCPAAKRRKPEQPRLVFVAVSQPSSAAAQGGGRSRSPSNPPADFRIAVVGYICIQGVEHYADPQGKEFEDLSAMRLGRRHNVDKYETPICVKVSRSACFEEPVLCQMPENLTKSVKLPGSALDVLACTTVRGCGQPLSTVEGLGFFKWPAWLCGKDLPPFVRAAMETRSRFRWPVFPGEVHHLGLKLADPPQQFHVCHYLRDVGSDSEEAGSESEGSGGREEEASQERRGAPNFHGSRCSPARLLKFLELKALLRPGASERQALALAAELLGQDPNPVLDPQAFAVPARQTMMRASIKLDMGVMLWSRHRWRKGYHAASSLMADTSEQHHHNYLCQRMDSVVVPYGLPTHQQRQLDIGQCFRRAVLPLGVFGYGEANLANKLRLVLHAAKLLTGTPEGLHRWRHSVRGLCADPGVERFIADAPNVSDPRLVEDAVAKHHAGHLQLHATEPDSFFLPNAVLVSGPLHLVWDAFESAVKAAPEWEAYKEFLSNVLSFLGHHGLRDRFLRVCMLDATAEQRQHFYRWKHHIIDWRWEYMEEALGRLSLCIDVFPSKLDTAKLKRPIGEHDGVVGIDLKSVPALEASKANQAMLSAETQMYSVFARACGQAARWFTGRPCHDHIWTLPLSDAAKMKRFQREVGARVQECVWRGRRGSELARGTRRELVANVRDASSAILQQRLGLLTEAQRAALVRRFDHLKTSWCEEVYTKWSFWEQLPHVLFGMWPADGRSQDMALQACQQWDAAQAQGEAKYCHRVAQRVMNPASGTCFPVLVRALAETGEMHPDLEVEVRAMNMAATCEQRIEEVHAKIGQLNMSTGRSLDPPSTSARLRQLRNLEVLGDWRACMFFIHMWDKRLARELLQGVTSQEFCRHANKEDCTKAVYHCLPRQTLVNTSADKALQLKFREATKLPASSVPQPVRLAVDYFKDRLCMGTVFSVPSSAVPCQGLVDGGPASQVVHPVQSIVPQALELACQGPPGRTQAKMGRDFAVHKLFKVVRADLSSRFLQHGPGHKSCLISVVALCIEGRFGVGGIFKPAAQCLVQQWDLWALLEQHGIKGLLENLVCWDASGPCCLVTVAPNGRQCWPPPAVSHCPGHSAEALDCQPLAHNSSRVGGHRLANHCIAAEQRVRQQSCLHTWSCAGDAQSSGRQRIYRCTRLSDQRYDRCWRVGPISRRVWLDARPPEPRGCSLAGWLRYRDRQQVPHRARGQQCSAAARQASHHDVVAIARVACQTPGQPPHLLHLGRAEGV